MDGVALAAAGGALLALAIAVISMTAYARLARAVTMVAAPALPDSASGAWEALPAMGRALVAGRTAEARAMAEAARRRELMEASLDPMVSVDLAGRIVDFNRAAERAFGRGTSEVRGRPVATVVDPESLLAAQRRAFSEFLATPHDRRRDHRVTATGRRADGSTFPVELAVTVLDTDDGPLFHASLRDISDRQAAQEARRESVAKSRFLAAMSHELRTPLNSILGFAQLLESRDFGTLNAQQRRYVQNIEASGQHLLAVINEVLDLARVQSGRMVLEPAWLDAVAVVREVAAQVEPLAAERALLFEVQAPAEARVFADATRLRQVLTNLAGNAIKFTPPGGHLVIRCRLDEPEAGMVTIDVEDTGPGIAQEDMERIFEEFVQVDGEGRALAGTGLGLPISRRLMELMGGRLEVTSGEGCGSTFSMVVPARRLRRVDTGSVSVDPAVRGEMSGA